MSSDAKCNIIDPGGEGFRRFPGGSKVTTLSMARENKKGYLLVY